MTIETTLETASSNKQMMPKPPAFRIRTPTLLAGLQNAYPPRRGGQSGGHYEATSSMTWMPAMV